MTLPLRILLTACLLVGLLFCLFGMLSTFEPGDRSVMWAFRLAFLIAGAGTLVALTAVWRIAQRR